MKLYQHNNLAGCVTQRRNRTTRHVVSIYHAAQAGIDAADPWCVVCETHGTILSRPTLDLAYYYLGAPRTWCEECNAATVKGDSQ